MYPENPKIIHTADWHLGAPTTWGSPGINPGQVEYEWINMFWNYRKKAIERVVREAIKNKVAAVLVAGDMIDVYGTSDTERSNRMKDAEAFLKNNVITPCVVTSASSQQTVLRPKNRGTVTSTMMRGLSGPSGRKRVPPQPTWSLPNQRTRSIARAAWKYL